MLRELRVKNFAIVEDGTLSLETGMTAFTGETGAGKSLLLDAVTLLLGTKARSDLVRSGAKVAEVEGVFDLTKDPDKRALAEELGFSVDLEDDGSLLLVRREISAQEVGRNRIWIQGRSATRSQLQELLGDWVEVSGQHEFLRLGRENYVLNLVDQFGGLKDEARSFTEAFEKLRELQLRCEGAAQAEANREARLDYLRFQVEEFERAGINSESEKEEERLVALRARLGSVEKIRVALETCRSILEGAESGDRSGAGLVSGIQSLLRELRPFESFGEDFALSVKAADESSSALLELDRSVGRILDSLEADPSALESAESRLSHINRLKRKYNADMGELVTLLEAARKEIDELGSSEDRIEILRAQVANAEERVKALALGLHERRVDAASALEKLWQKDIRLLGMSRARLELKLDASDTLSPLGATRMEALFSANPGEAPKPLGKVASGGELSRIMLALKHIVAGRSEIGVYLFDEVDAGIGGETAQAVGQRLRELASDNQVLVVTHLAQIAARGHHQFRIKKSTEKGRTRTVIDPLLRASDRENEIARMLGDTGSKAALNLAKELLKQTPKSARTRATLADANA